MSTTAIVRTHNGIDQAVENAFGLLGMQLKSNVPIIIKPNLCCIRTHETGLTTNPAVVEAIVTYVKRHFSVNKILLVESDATALNADVAFQLLGFNKLAQRLDVEILNLSKISYVRRNFPMNLNLRSIKIPRIFTKPHFLISVAKMKTHSDCSFTATLKNMYGCNPEPYKAKYHDKLHQNIVDLASVFRPDLSIIDATIAMEGTGPIGGTPLKLDTLMFGSDPLATDCLVAEVMGMNPKRISWIKLAKEQQLGDSRAETVGVDPEKIKMKFRTTPFILRLSSRMRPWAFQK